MKTSQVGLLFLAVINTFMSVAPAAVWHTDNTGRRYLIEGDASYNWLQAWDQCVRWDLQLAVMDTASKYNSLVILLRQIFGKSRDIWLGHHDEFNKKKDKGRTWYTASSGQIVRYANWDSGEPNNKKGEHCTQIYRKADFKWNDENCDTHQFGYICEEHYLSTKCRKDLEQKRGTTNQKNTQLLTEFKKTESEIEKINANTSAETENILISSQTSYDAALEQFRTSFNALIKERPYMEAVMADIGEAVRELTSSTYKELSNISEQTIKQVQAVHTNAEKSTNVVVADFSKKLSANTNEINDLLV